LVLCLAKGAGCGQRGLLAYLDLPICPINGTEPRLARLAFLTLSLLPAFHMLRFYPLLKRF